MDNPGRDEQKRLNQEEQYNVTMSRGIIREMKQEITELSRNVSLIRDAVTGNEEYGQEGIVKRLETVEKGVEELSNKMSKAELLAKIIWALAGGLGIALLALFKDYLLKK